MIKFDFENKRASNFWIMVKHLKDDWSWLMMRFGEGLAKGNTFHWVDRFFST